MLNKKILFLSAILMVLTTSCVRAGPSSSSDSSESSSSYQSSESSSSGESSESSSSDVPVEKSVFECCDELNDFIKTKNPFDPFEARDFAIDSGYNYITNHFEDNHFIGYDYETSKFVVYKMNQNNTRDIVYPTSLISHECVSYQNIEVDSYETLSKALTNISIDYQNYSVIKLATNITLDNPNSVTVAFSSPIEFDLNGKTIDATYNTSSVRVNDENAVVHIKSGTIKTFTYNEFDFEVSPKCVYAQKAASIRISNVSMYANCRRGYGYIDSLESITSMKTRIEDCGKLYAGSVPICVQNKNNSVELLRDTIDGSVSINSGNVIVDGCTITVQDRHDEATGLISNEFIAGYCELYFVNNVDRYDTYMITSVDPIIVLDRRSIKGTYDSPSAVVKNCTLTPDNDNAYIYGYGIRYIDLGFDTSKASSCKLTIENNNVFPLIKSGSPSEQPGGYTKYFVSK